eukprot:m.24988 g.24988  ORF g.24988 m.24988 type:complete len:50 (-) comp8667_c1_seq2:90-239(-)
MTLHYIGADVSCLSCTQLLACLNSTVNSTVTQTHTYMIKKPLCNYAQVQ